MSQSSAFLYDHVRTPRGKGRTDGALHGTTPVELASQVLQALMQRNRLEAMLGCASMPMYHPGLAYGEGAASIWQQLRTRYLAEPAMQVQPYTALPLPAEGRGTPAAANVQPPALIQGYLRMGAKVLGAPAWDPDFQTADLPLMARIADLPARYRRQPG